MLRRNLIHAWRYPSMTLLVAAIPVIFYLIFVYVFGSTLGNGLPGTEGGRDAYVAYVTPGILLLAVMGGTQSTAITVSMVPRAVIRITEQSGSCRRAASSTSRPVRSSI